MDHRISRSSPVAFILSLGIALPAIALAQSPEVSAISGAAPTAASSPAPSGATLDQLIDTELGTPGGLTAEDVARRAAETSPSVAGRGAELSAASASLDRASLAYLPTTTLTGRYARLSDTRNGSLGNLVVAPGAASGALPPDTRLA